MIHHVESEIKPQHDSIWIPAFLLHFPCLHFLYRCSHIFGLFFLFFIFSIHLFFISSYYFLSLTAIFNLPPCFLLRGRHSSLKCCTNLHFTCSQAHLKYPSMHLTSAPAGRRNNIKDKRTRLQSEEKFWKSTHGSGNHSKSFWWVLRHRSA